MLIFTIILIAVAAVFEWLSLKNHFRSVNFTSEMTKKLVEPDEPFEIVSAVENCGRFPISFIEAEERLPIEFQIADGAYSKPRVREFNKSEWRLGYTVYLWSRQRRERRLTVSIPKRGRFIVRGASLKTGDFFGLSKSTQNFDLLSEIVVMPKRADDCPEVTALGGFLGDISVRRFMMEDPVLTLGFSDYTGTEPQKAISWKQSARLNRLMVKRYDYTLEPSVTVMLNVECNVDDPDWQIIERAFSLARSVCELLEGKRIKYDFITNATTAGAISLWSSVTEGLGSAHLGAILEGLGRATYNHIEPFEITLKRAARRAEAGRSHIIVTPHNDEGINHAAKQLKDKTLGFVTVIPAS